MQLRNEGMKFRNEGVEFRSEGVELRTEGLELRSEGLELRSKVEGLLRMYGHNVRFDVLGYKVEKGSVGV